MADIKPILTSQDILCADAVAGPAGVVVFGASGDLTRRKLLVSLFELFRRDLLSEHFYVVGVARSTLTDQDFHRSAEEAIRQQVKDVPAQRIEAFIERLYFVSGDYSDASLYADIVAKLDQLNKRHQVDNNYVFYLAVPPFLYATIVQQLHQVGLSHTATLEEGRKKVRLVVEKPFGRDTESAAELDGIVRKSFDESRIYRIDHYMGKETVQNILVFRFANTIFEPVWNRNYIDSVQITIAESLGVEHRASYYDKSGALRDIFQNHMLQMLALVAMEPPTSFEADRIRDEKVKLLRAVRPFEIDRWDELIVRGQYGPGLIDGREVVGYRSEPGVEAQSKTETFVAAKLFVDNWRWKDVPFYLRTGKRLAVKDTEIVVKFKKIPHSMFFSAGLGDMPSNILVLQIQPEEGIKLAFQAKYPGSKICVSTLDMTFSYKDVFGIGMPEAYERLLLDCMLGDQTLFAKYDAVEIAWQLLTPVLQAWQDDDSSPCLYPAGSESFPEADNLIERDGGKWRELGTL